ncbi:hypothetical protein CCZ01_02065 [Helicobacter monodelphidis]|uniref:hypothetical protein n=1 Tax=Helicobacter sp. 15-1451 TaxID=2004995 RepID=UPI000DCB67AF|nr:hypothetical protein [Helicobacter sp. 15-1451]RAX58593.1 hypothetical protein CCZ01_02065 [Helicobacter sp. 15-1451]
MRLFLKILVGFFILLAILITLPFTSLGNSLMKPYIQDTINQYSPLPLEMTEFQLGFSSFNVEIKGEESVFIHLKGSFSVLALSLEAFLNVDVKDLAYASKLAGMDLKGAFVLEVVASGDMNLLEVAGTSNIANSQTKFAAEIKDLNFSNLHLQIKDAEVQTLLATIAQPPYAKALLDITAAVSNDISQGLGGNAELLLKNGEVDGVLIQKQFGVTVPKTQFNTKLLTSFSGENVSHDLLVKSNVGSITTNGTTNINTLATNSKYALNVSDLSPLTPIAQIPLRGQLNVLGTVKGDKKSLLIDGTTDIADSKTTYRATLVEFFPSLAEVSIQSLKIDQLLHMLHQPIYTSGRLNLNAKLSDFNDGISGEIALNIPSGRINGEVMKKTLALDMPSSSYTLSSKGTMHRGSGEFNTSLKSDIANLTVNPTAVTLNPSFAVKTPYEISIADLGSLKFVTGIPLRGAMSAKGNVSLNDSGLQADFLSQILGGVVTANLANNIIDAKLDKLRSEQLLSMLTYRPFFESELNGTFHYELLSEQGALEAVLSNGHLAKSPLTDIVLPLLKVDLTREVYQNASLKSVINKKVISSDVTLKSHNTAITTKSAKINTENNQIDALLTLSIKEKPTNITVKGDLNKPKISIDAVNQAIDKAKDKLQQAVDKQKDKVQDKLNQAIDKKLQSIGDENKEGVKNLLQNIINR